MSSYPGPKPHRIMTSAERAHTEPLPNGFMRAVMGHRDMDDLDEGVMIMPTYPKRKITQEEQDAIDEKARKRAMRNLVNSWQERLQLISVITTFFASTEAAMLVNTKPINTEDWANNTLKASNASLLGALVLHVYAAVLSFLGAFLLIRYKLKEATREEMIAEGIKIVNSPLEGTMLTDVGQDAIVDFGTKEAPVKEVHNGTSRAKEAPMNNRAGHRNSYPVEPPVISAKPHLEQVGLFQPTISSHILSRTHGLCVFLAAGGFILAIAGVMFYAWALQPIAVSVFVSACLGLSLLALVVLLI